MDETFSSDEITKLKKSGRIVKETFAELKKMIRVGQTPLQVETRAREIIESSRARPAFLNFPSQGKPYPTALCISINEQVVHHPPDRRPFQENDLVSVDMGVEKDGFYADACFSICLGDDPEKNRLIKAVERALEAAIAMAKPGNHLGDIGYAIKEEITRSGFSIVEGLSGHGIGRELHQEPSVLNYGNQGQGLKLKAGTALAIEPIGAIGNGKIKDLGDPNDPWTVVTEDSSVSAHVEDTILIRKDGPKVLTN